MATRNRTPQFEKRRQYYKELRGAKSAPKFSIDQEGPAVNLLKTTNGHTEASSLTPGWVQVSEEVNGLLPQIKSRLVELTKKQARRLLPGFLPENESDLEKQIEETTSDIAEMLRSAEQKVRAIGPMQANPNRKKQAGDKQGRIGATPKELLRMNVQSSLASQLAELSMQFRQEQKNYYQKLKGQEDTRFAITNHTKSAEPQPALLTSLDTGSDSDEADQAQRAELILAQEKNREVEKISSSINELASIIKDLSVLVIDQGTLLDRIDYNVEQTSRHMEDGLGQLEQAEKYQKSTRFMTFVICAGCVIFALVVVIIFKHR